MSARDASKASPRCAAAVATTTAASPIASRPTRCTAATRQDVVPLGDGGRDVVQALQGAGVGGVLQADDVLVVVVVADGADEHVDAADGAGRRARHHLGDVQRGLAQVDETYDGQGGRSHAEPSGGCGPGCRSE